MHIPRVEFYDHLLVESCLLFPVLFRKDFVVNTFWVNIFCGRLFDVVCIFFGGFSLQKRKCMGFFVIVCL